MSERPIEGIEWRGDGETSLRLENGRVSGSGGINRLMGDYTLTGDELSFGMLATTMMAGPPERMEAEQRFLAALGTVARWTTVAAAGEPEAGVSLVLAGEDGVELLRFVVNQSV